MINLSSLKKNLGFVFKGAVATGLMFSLSGCLMTGPYWAQNYDSRSDSVNMQAFTVNSNNVIFECSKAYHGGLYPAFGTPTWNFVASIIPSGMPAYDSNGGKMYNVSRSQVLPSACWHFDGATGKYMTALRARQTNGSSTTTYNVFDENGLACLGKEVGATGSWVGWINKGCILTYSGSTTAIPYVRILADS